MRRYQIFALLFVLLTVASTQADERARYDQMKVDINELKRELGEAHKLRRYPSAIELQEELTAAAQAAFQFAQETPGFHERGARIFYVDNLMAAGRYEAALEQLDIFLKTPLLERGGFREGWRKKSKIYQRLDDVQRTKESLLKALSYADDPHQQVQLTRELAQLELKQQNYESAEELARDIKELLPEVRGEQQLNAELGYLSLLVKLFRETDQTAEARAARLEEMKLRRRKLDQEINHFSHRYPED